MHDNDQKEQGRSDKRLLSFLRLNPKGARQPSLTVRPQGEKRDFEWDGAQKFQVRRLLFIAIF